MENILKKFNTIKNNKFINDMNWRARAEQNVLYAKEIREEIALLENETKEDRKNIVDILDYLDYHNL